MNIGQMQLRILEGTKGKAAAAWAKQTMQAYRKAVLTSRKRGFASPHFGSLPEYRRSFISFYLYLKQYIRKQEETTNG
jgi:hypothetical protein